MLPAIHKIKKWLTTPKLWKRLLLHKLAPVLPDAFYLKRLFPLNTGERLDLKNPQTFNQKLQWLKLYNRRDIYTVMADKVKAKEFVAERIGDKYIIPTYGVWERPEDVDFDALPSKFVIKCNHNSGIGMYICRDKSRMDIDSIRRELARGLADDYFVYNREWPYKNIPRRILAEQLLEPGEGQTDLNDYKVLCFDGEPRLIEYHAGRFTNDHTQDFLDTDWNLTGIAQVGEANSKTAPPRPELLDEMLRLSRILAADTPHLRVDWYMVNGKLYFGELTFFDASGFDSFTRHSDDLLLGSWITLPTDKKIKSL